MVTKTDLEKKIALLKGEAEVLRCELEQIVQNSAEVKIRTAAFYALQVTK